MRVKMSQPVRWSDGVVRTPRQAVDAGIAEIRVSERFSGNGRSAPRRAVFAVEIGTGSEEDGITLCVEVSGYVAP